MLWPYSVDEAPPEFQRAHVIVSDFDGLAFDDSALESRHVQRDLARAQVWAALALAREVAYLTTTMNEIWAKP